MVWIKVDDHYDEHPKHAAAGPLGHALWLAGLAYCNRNLTDGFIPWATAQSLLTWKFLGPPDENGQRKEWTTGIYCGAFGDDVTCAFVIDLLLQTGLWEQAPNGYYVHDYPMYQPLKVEVIAQREKTSMRVRAFRKRERNAVSNSVSNGVTHTIPHIDVTPDVTPLVTLPPVPVPISTKRKNKYSCANGLPPGFSEWWTEYPKKVGKQQAIREWIDLDPDELLRKSMLEAILSQKRTVRAMVENDRHHILDPVRWLKYRRWEDELPVTTQQDYPKL